MTLPKNDLKKAELARFWKDAFLGGLAATNAFNQWERGGKKAHDLQDKLDIAADFADGAVARYRKRFSV